MPRMTWTTRPTLLALLLTGAACGSTALDGSRPEPLQASTSASTSTSPAAGGRDVCADDEGLAACPETPDAAPARNVPDFVATLDDASWQAWRDHIVPADDELTWMTIPWVAAFGEGLAAARAAGKPLLFWGMNGHPLGCT